VTRGWLPQRAGSLGLNSGGTAAAVSPPKAAERRAEKTDIHKYTTTEEHND